MQVLALGGQAPRRRRRARCRGAERVAELEGERREGDDGEEESHAEIAGLFASAGLYVTHGRVVSQCDVA